MTAVLVLAQRELLHFYRQPSRLLGSLLQPLLFWLFMGAGFSGSFTAGAALLTYQEFLYPGIVLMLLLFAAIFSTITLIEDRNAGFLQGVLVAPVPRLALVLGKVVGGTGISLIQGLVFLCFAPLAGIALSVGTVAALVALFALVGLGFTGLGFAVAWGSETVSGYHAVMSVVMIPLWLLSGALFPMEGSAAWLVWVMRCNPVTYAMTLIRMGFYQPLPVLLGDLGFLTALGATLLWTALVLGSSVYLVVRR